MHNSPAHGVVECRCPRSRHEHGTRGAYVYDRCRCFPCRYTYSRVSAAYAAGQSWTDGAFPSPVGIRRRIEALHAIGWSSTELATRLGITRQAVRSLRCHAGQNALRSTLDRVAAVYDELWDQTPSGRLANRTRNWAHREGFLPPLAWDDDTIDDPSVTPHIAETGGVDEIAVELATAGQPPSTLTKAERALAIKRLTNAGFSAKEIAVRLRVSSRQVVRDRAA